MQLVDWLVIVGAVVAIAWVNWYFFAAERPSGNAADTASGGAGARGAHGDQART